MKQAFRLVCLVVLVCFLTGGPGGAGEANGPIRDSGFKGVPDHGLCRPCLGADWAV